MVVDLESNLSEGGFMSYNRPMALPTVAKLPNIPPIKFIKEVVTELKKVTWPTRDETVKLTAVVIAISVIVGIFIGSLDYTLVSITSLLFKK